MIRSAYRLTINIGRNERPGGKWFHDTIPSSNFLSGDEAAHERPRSFSIWGRWKVSWAAAAAAGRSNEIGRTSDQQRGGGGCPFDFRGERGKRVG